MLEMVSGALVALCFLGSLDCLLRAHSTAETQDLLKALRASREVSASATNHADDKRRRVIYGRYSVVTTASAERYGSRRTHGRKV
jgi:hypothetical protein